MNTFDGRCGSCVEMNTNDYVRTKDHCYCTLRKQYYDLNERKCSYYKYDPYKDYYELNHRWYIVTAIFKKLGLSDNYECTSLIHNFRNNVLANDPRYTDMLAEYDIVGPKIAQKLLEDEESESICKRLLQTYLGSVLDLLREEKYDEALDQYIQMVSLLKLYYDVDFITNEEPIKIR